MIFYRSSFQALSDQVLHATPNIRTLHAFGLFSASLPKLRLLRGCEDVTLPSTIGRLLYLHTIDLRYTELDSQVPNTLWDIPTLRHVYLWNGFPPPPAANYPMPVLEKLPCLVVLMLGGYEGQTMSCSAQGFPRLQELQLVKFSMEKWGMEEGTMPKLYRLTLCVCGKLSRLPEGLLNLLTLNQLVLECVPLISEDDTTLNELKQKRCKYMCSTVDGTFRALRTRDVIP
ncbi:hypothetical protein VPH35_133137 [Triticum aestivum]